jgi:hypothetical protein
MGAQRISQKSYVFSLNTVQALQVQGAPIIEL